jgi:hypothetical protein
MSIYEVWERHYDFAEGFVGGWVDLLHEPMFPQPHLQQALDDLVYALVGQAYSNVV